MASNIRYAPIDGNYPYAGQNNDTQGFRDNFSTIKNSLQVANEEVTTLQEDTAKLNEDNNFQGNKIVDTDLTRVTNSFYFNNTPLEVTDGDDSENISFNDGHYQKFIVNRSNDNANNNLTLDLGGNGSWINGRVCTIRLELIGGIIQQDVDAAAGDRNIEFRVNSGSTLYKNFTDLVIDDDETIYIFDIWTYDGGSSIHLHKIVEFSTS